MGLNEVFRGWKIVDVISADEGEEEVAEAEAEAEANREEGGST